MKDTNIQNVLSVGLMAVISVMVFMLFYRETPPTNKELVSLALGVLLGSMKDVFNYYFGSTRSSDRKDEIVRNALNQAPSDPAAKTEPLAAGATVDGARRSDPAV